MKSNQSKPKFDIGQIVRYGKGPTALMKIIQINPNHGGTVRYYGRQCMGSLMGAYEFDCVRASPSDLDTWESANAEKAETVDSQK